MCSIFLHTDLPTKPKNVFVATDLQPARLILGATIRAPAPDQGHNEVGRQHRYRGWLIAGANEFYIFPLFSCVIASSANLASQKLAGAKQLNTDSVMAYGLFGLIFTGPLSHFFYGWLDRVTNDVRFKKLLMLFGERLLFAPTITALSLYFISRFEYKSHDEAIINLVTLFRSVLRGNWKFLTLPVFINFNYVPPMVSCACNGALPLFVSMIHVITYSLPPQLRVLFANIIGFCWILFLSAKRRKAEQRRQAAAAGETSKSS